MQTDKTSAPAPGRRLSVVTAPVDRDRALRTVRRARTQLDGRWSRAAVEERQRRFAHLKRAHD